MKSATTFLAPKSCLRDLRTFINKIRYAIIFLKNRESAKNYKGNEQKLFWLQTVV